jgi:hypothetical protein
MPARLRRPGQCPRGSANSQTVHAGIWPHAKRGAAIEPSIGHLQSDNLLERSYLAGIKGGRINAVLSAAGYNFRKLLRWVVFAPNFWLCRRIAVCLALVIDLRRDSQPQWRAQFGPSRT